MGMYDQLLSVTQQGLDRNNQIAMASAQQPTMADVFMDRFRQGGQDRMAAQKMQSDMALNQAYKNAQMQKMKDDAANALLQRKTQFLQSAGGMQGVTPDTRQGWATEGAELGIPDHMFPTQQFQETPIMQDVEPNLTPSSLRFSTQEDMGGPTQVGTERLPIGNTGYSPQLEYMRDMMDLRGQAAANKTANGQGKPYKFGDPVARLIEEARMMAEAGHPMPKAVFDDRMSLLRTYPNPNAAGAYSQGVAVAPRLAPMTLPDSAYPEPHQPAQPQQQSPAPVQQFNTAVDGIKDKKAAVVAPVMKAAGVPLQPPAQKPKAAGPVTVAQRSTPLTPKGAQEVAKFTQAHDTAISSLDEMSQLVDRIADSPGLERALGRDGAINRNDITFTDKQAHDAWVQVARLIQAGTLKELRDLKATNTTLGQVSNQEGERLEKAFAALNPNQDAATFIKELRRIQSEIHNSRRIINKAASANVGSLGQAPIEFHEIGEQQPDSQGNVWEYRGKTYANRSNWRMVQKAGGK